MKKLLLISMPMPNINIPSIELGILQAFLKQHGISVDTMSLYIPFADNIGFEKYEELSKTDLGDAIFSVLLYPQMRKSASLLIKKKTDNRFIYNDLFNQAETFIDEIVKRITINDYEYIGFSIVFNQLFSSLVLAKRIKQINPSIRIVFGGNGCNEEKGVALMQVFPEIDYIISCEGEYPLLHLMEGCSPENIHGLTYRNNGTIVKNPPCSEIVGLGNQPVPDFTEYFERIRETRYLKKSSKFSEGFWIPVETCRSCWWNKCTFCSLNIQYQGYREKSNTKIIEEIIMQKNKYNIKRIYFISNNIILRKTGELFTLLKPLGLRIWLKYSARLSNFNLLKQLKEAGVENLQFGLESLSKTLLEKNILKGIHLIDSIQVLKFLKELNIKSYANLITRYPNETKAELKEAIKNFRFLYHLEPPTISSFRLDYKSPIFNNPNSFNIRTISIKEEHRKYIPERILYKLIFDSYDFSRKVKLSYPQHIFMRELYRWMNKFLNNSSYPLLYYKISNGILTIRDSRGTKTVDYKLGKTESDIYLFCHSSRKLEEIYKYFSSISRSYINAILDYFLRHRLMFRDDDSYISLAIDLKTHKKYLLRDGVKMHKYSGCKQIHLKSP